MHLKTIYLFILFSVFIFSHLFASDTLHIQLISKTSKWEPIDVKVNIKNKKEIGISDEKGQIVITDLKPGKYVLIFDGEGFRPTEKKIEPKHFKSKTPLKVEMYPYWSFHGTENLLFSQAAFGNYWRSGGINAITIVGRVNMSAIHKKRKGSWENTLKMAYGFIKQANHEFIKNEDQIDFSMKYGRNFSPRFLFTTLLNVKTHFSPTYKINKDGSKGELRSRFLAPAYINLGTGLDYQLKSQGLSVYYSPINSKLTIVNDSSLTALYMPKNLEDQTSRYELGSYLKVKYKKEIFKNVVLQTKADFFTNHLQNFGSIDVDWETQMAFKVNKFLTANILTHLIYDEDIEFMIKDTNGEPERNEYGEPTGRKGPRTQFKEMLNIGLTHKF